jgi:hypothetical protein
MLAIAYMYAQNMRIYRENMKRSEGTKEREFSRKMGKI